MDVIDLPESLKKQFSVFERRLKRMETLLALGVSVAGLLFTFLILFALDRWFDTPRVLRLLLALSGGFLVGWRLYAWTKNWLWRRRGKPQLAMLLQRKYRHLGDRLQGAVELTEGGPLPENISPSLCQAAVSQVAEEAQRVDFQRAVSMKRAGRWMAAATALILLIALPLLLIQGKWLSGARAAAANTMERYAKPLVPIDRYTFTALDKLPATIHVPLGEEFKLSVTYQKDSVWKPAEGLARLGNQPPVRSDFVKDRANYVFPPQTSDSDLQLRVGDARKSIHVEALPRPEIMSLDAIVVPPAYLGHPPRTVEVSGSSVSVLRQASLGFTGVASRTLSSAQATAAGGKLPVTVTGNSFAIAPRPLQNLGDKVSIEWEDVHGLAAVEPYKLNLTPVEDGEPSVEFLDLEREGAALPDDVIKFQIVSEDDYGVKASWVEWVCSNNGADGVHEISKGKLPVIPGGQQEKSLAKGVTFSPKWYEIPQDTTVELTAYTVDYFPGRKPSASWTYKLFVLSKEKHAQRVQERMEEAFRHLEDRIREEEGHVDENESLQRNPEQLESDEGAEDIEKLEGSERANRDMLDNLAKEMGDIMKEALRNSEVPEKTLSEWSEQLKNLNETAKPAMDKAADKLKSASERKANPSESKDDPGENKKEQPSGAQGQPSSSARQKELKEALEQQKKALEAMRKSSKEMNSTTEDLTARNFYNRLKRSGAVENEISETMRAIAPDVIGLAPDEIGADHRKSFELATSRQTENEEEVRSIISDITGFLKRAQAPKHAQVRQEMESKKTVSELAELNRMIGGNLSMRAIISSREWGKQLDDWAEMLKEEASDGKGGGEMDPDLLELSIKLMRAAKEEDNIRDQTNFLELTRSVSQDYEEETGFLGARQEQLADTVKGIMDTTKFKDVVPLLREVDGQMRQVIDMLRSPQTDEEVVAEESSIIEKLLPPPKDSDSSSSPSSGPALSQMQEMQRQLMQQMKAMSPGGNPNGGGTSRPNEAVEGPATGSTGQNRRVEKTGSSVDPSEWPEEYRDSLQQYFDQIDAVKP